MKHLKLDKNNILIFIIGILSLINIPIQISAHNYLSIANSIIGLAGVVMFLMSKSVFRYLVWIWIVAQAIIIEHTAVDSATGVIQKEMLFDLSQIFNLKIGFYASGNTNTYGLDFNALVILYFIVFRNLKTSSYIGKTIGLLFMKGNLDLQFDERTFATLMQRVNLDGDDNWLLGELNTPIHYNGNEYNRLLVHTEDGLLTHTFRLVPASATIAAGVNRTLQFERAVWIMIE